MPLDDTGFRALRGTDLLDQIRTDFETLSGLTPDWERDTFLGPITAAAATQLGNLASQVQAIYDARDPENAVGVALANIARLSGLTPRDATFSTFEGLIEGTAGLELNTSQLRVIVDGIDWTLSEDIVIGVGGSVTATFTAAAYGAKTATFGASSGAGLTIATPVYQLDDVTVGDLVLGREPETDEDLYVRWRQSLQVRGSRSVNAIRARVLDDFPTITGCIVIENDQATSEVIEGITIDGPAVAVIVDPDQESDVEALLAETLYGLVAVGIRMVGTTAYTISGTGVSAKVARWTYGAEVDATVVITIRMEPTTPGRAPPPSFAEAASDVEDAIEAYRLTLGLGDDLTLLDLQGIAGDVVSVRSVTALTIASDPVDGTKIDADGNLTLTAAERIGAVAVTVLEAS